MRHTNTVFHDILKLVPWGDFDRIIAEQGADASARSFTTRDQFVCLLFAQLSGACSLRDIETVMASHQSRLYHLGVEAPKRSTLSDANRDRDARVFTALFERLLASASRGFRRKMGDALRLIDSTSLHLSGMGSRWAHFSADLCGAKAHVVYDPDLGRPIYHAVTAANVNDITAAKQMPIDPAATYVFDLGYYDFAWWAALHQAQCRLVTRFKSNTPLHVVRSLRVPKGADIVSDRIGFLPARQSKNRKNPMPEAVREVVVKIQTGKTLRLLSNDLDSPAQEIADLYKRRWQIELFFRAMKQTLRITKFIGRSENAVRIQIAVALIAFLLLRRLQEFAQEKHGFLELVRLVRANLMHRKPATRLRQTSPPPPLDSRQLELQWTAT